MGAGEGLGAGIGMWNWNGWFVLFLKFLKKNGYENKILHILKKQTNPETYDLHDVLVQ